MDRAVATADWCAHFVNAVVEILLASTSDHRPLYLQFDSRSRIAPKLFRFEAKWNLDDECSKVISEAWVEEGGSRGSLGSIWSSMVRCKVQLQDWNKAKFGSTEKQIGWLTKRLDRLQSMESPGNVDTIKNIQNELNKLLEMEEMKWR